uniref:Thioredoxin-like protein YLS8 n=1 Tax=Ananas comosus var. bracteatus TaxID=296719 RepID=A0A6V7PS61_ANACO|nr:unnamed protein product [Ananas comosus var. bracteatus]
MSYLLPHLHSGWAVDQAILAEEERLVIIRFGHDWDETCMQMDEVLASVAETIKNFAVIYLVDITEVPDFNTMYELYDPSTVMFFFRNKHIMIDLGTGTTTRSIGPSRTSRSSSTSWRLSIGARGKAAVWL